MAVSSPHVSQPEEITGRCSSSSRPVDPAATTADSPVNHVRSREQMSSSSSSCSQRTTLVHRTSVSSSQASSRARRPSATSSSPLSFVESYLRWSVHYQVEVTTQHPRHPPQSPPAQPGPDQQTHVPEPDQLPQHMREPHPHFHSPTEGATRRLFPDTTITTQPIPADQYRHMVAANRFDIETGIGGDNIARHAPIACDHGYDHQLDADHEDATVPAQQLSRSTSVSARARKMSKPVKSGGFRAKCAHVWRSTRLIGRKPDRGVTSDTDREVEQAVSGGARLDHGWRSMVKRVYKSLFHVK